MHDFYSMDYLKSWKCLVTIKYANEIENRFVDCVEDSKGKFLLIPLDDYPTVDFENNEITLRPLPGAIVESGHPDYELVYHELVDLDEFEELPFE